MAPQTVANRVASGSIYLNAFVIGGVLMGFEMLGSRYLYPYFGGGIGTWAGLISMVLCALTVGYFAGGEVVDRYPSSRVVAVAVGVAAAYLALVPLGADHVMSSITETIGDGPLGILLAAAALLLLPLSLLGTFSPFAVRLLIRSTSETGRVAGFVYGISTIGSVCGTLFTTFALIPTIGSRAITYIYAGILAASAATLFLTDRKTRCAFGHLTGFCLSWRARKTDGLRASAMELPAYSSRPESSSDFRHRSHLVMCRIFSSGAEHARWTTSRNNCRSVHARSIPWDTNERSIL